MVFGDFSTIGLGLKDIFGMLANCRYGGGKLMEKLNVSELDFCAHDVEEESFERLDDIYDSVRQNEMLVEGEDIIRLCNIFKQPFKEKHPHQYTKICKITFHIIDEIGEEKGFEFLIKGLKNMPENHVKNYLGMLNCSYDREKIELFKDKLKNIPKEEQEYIWQCWAECVQE